MTKAELIRHRYEELSGVYWQHTIQLLPDLIAKGGKTTEDLDLERGLLIDLLNLQGRTVIDIGSWTGYHAFEAKRAGASRVIATDKFAWNSASWRGRETFELARDSLELDVEALEIDPTELPGPLQPADVVFFLGVFYHMHEPVSILKRVCALARDVLVLETHQDLQQLDRPAMAFYPRETLQGDPSNWWGPNPECMVELLESVGLPHVFYQEGRAGGQRGYFHAFRSEATAQSYLRRTPDNVSLFDMRSEAGRRAVYGTVSLSNAGKLADRLAEATTEMQRVQAQNISLQAELERTAAENMALRRSTSWRVTAPLRFAGGVLGRRPASTVAG
jgi:tRNA (mo5U34)-methyltransferase